MPVLQGRCSYQPFCPAQGRINKVKLHKVHRTPQEKSVVLIPASQ